METFRLAELQSKRPKENMELAILCILQCMFVVTADVFACRECHSLYLYKETHYQFIENEKSIDSSWDSHNH